MAKKYPWIDDDRVPSQAEIDYYGAQDTGGAQDTWTVGDKIPDISQEHLDEIAPGAGQMQASDVGYAPLSDKEQKDYNERSTKWGWNYIWRNVGGKRIKVGKDGAPIKGTAYGESDYDESEDNAITLDDDGRAPDEPGYNDPDYEPPFQTSGGETDMPTDAELDFLMDDDNFDIGGNLNTTNAAGENIETFEIGLGYGNEGGWTPTKKGQPPSRGKGQVAADGSVKKSGALRRSIRKLSPSLITASG